MKQSIKVGATVALMAMVLGLMALPAAAADIVVFSGTATVCGTDVGKKPAPGCDAGKPNGLYAPGGDIVNRLGTQPNKYLGRIGNWRLQASTCAKMNPTSVGDVLGAPVGCGFDVRGALGPVGGVVGAACGISNGYGGTGPFVAANGTNGTVSDVGWVTSAGGTLPVTGDYTANATKSGTKFNPGSFVGVVQAQGGSFCVKLPNGLTPVTGKHGASQFTVVGVIVMGLPPLP